MASDDEEVAVSFGMVEKDGDQGFSGFEHRLLGSNAFSKFINSTAGAAVKAALIRHNLFVEVGADQKLKFDFAELDTDAAGSDSSEEAGRTGLSAGDIVALAGDFYGPMKSEEVISATDDIEERKDRFEAAFDRLVAAETDSAQAAIMLKILDGIDEETYAVERAFVKLEPAIAGMESKEVPGTATYAKITAQMRFVPKALQIPTSPYIRLLRWNFDHFGDSDDALHAFEAGFAVALKTAGKAQNADPTGQSKEAADWLLTAIRQLLFAFHYLTDYFASGHIRTPRRTMCDVLRKAAHIYCPDMAVDLAAGLLSHEMHDEDGVLGLWYESDAIEGEWQAKGDSCLLDPTTLGAHDYIVAALVAALGDMAEAFQGRPARHTYKQHLPRVVAGRNHLPLFVIDNSDPGNPIILRRKELDLRVLKEQGIFDTKENVGSEAFYTAEWKVRATLKAMNKLHFWKDKAEAQKFTPGQRDAIFARWWQGADPGEHAKHIHDIEGELAVEAADDGVHTICPQM